MMLSSEIVFGNRHTQVRHAPAIAGYSDLGIDGVCIIDIVSSKDLIFQ